MTTTYIGNLLMTDNSANHCPLCGKQGRARFKKRDLTILECTNCHHQFWKPTNLEAHVAETYGDDYFQGSSAGYLDYVGEETIQRASARYYTRMLTRHTRPGRMTDVGAACGFFVKEFSDAGWCACGVEPNSSMRDFGQKKFGIDLPAAQLDDLPSSDRVDLISVIQVISHLIDPRQTLTTIHNRLLPGGLLLIETWDRSSLAARLSGEGWHEYNPPSVLHWFSRASLQKLVEEHGFEKVSQGIPRKRIQLGRAAKMIRHSTENSIIGRWLTWPLVLAPSNLAVPYFLGDAFWMLFRVR